MTYSNIFSFEVGGEGGAVIQDVNGESFCGTGGMEVSFGMGFGDGRLELGGHVVQSECRLMWDGLRGLLGRVVDSSVLSLSLDFLRGDG